MSRELDAQIAEQIMGAVWLYWPIRESRALRYDAKRWTLKPYKPGDLLTAPDELDDVHPYSTNLNYTRLAEQRMIELGKGEDYARALSDALNMSARQSYTLSLLTAPAEARCKAMLSVLKGKG